MVVQEDLRYSRDYLDPEKRAIPNAVQVFFRDGGRTERVEIAFPLGHPRRRAEALPRLVEQFAPTWRAVSPPNGSIRSP